MEKFTTKELQDLIKTCKTKADFCRALGLKPTGGNYRTIDLLIKEHNLDSSHFVVQPWNKGKKIKGILKQNLDEVLIKNSFHKNTYKLKERLINAGLKEYKCEICGYTDKVELHHINGDPTDNRLENLQMLCPNCHSKTDNYRAKNISGRVHNTPETYFMTEEEVKKREEERILRRREKQRIPEEQKKRKSKPLSICPVCGKEFKAEGTQKYCSVECYRKDSKGNRPELITLIDSFKECHSFVQVGLKYGVSDNAVRKWCRLYGIPDSTKELKEYINQNFNGEFKIPKKKELKNKVKFIQQFDYSDNLLNTFTNAREAGRWLVENIPEYKDKIAKSLAKTILECAHNRQRFAYNYIWKFKN